MTYSNFYKRDIRTPSTYFENQGGHGQGAGETEGQTG